MADSMNEETKLMLRKAFAMFDEEKTGFIEATQLGGILKDLGQTVDPDELKNTIMDMDVEGKALSENKVTFELFVNIVGVFLQDEDDEAMAEELREAFRLYDKEGNGYITTQTLREIMKELDNKLTEDDLDGIIDEVDEDGSGTVDFDEFMEMMTGE
ncbi:troponin C, isoallergen Bla g 6.0101 [Penaeus vannamei]|uniref:troponin C, isoallergen Bla g 6.0101 n=1 Tax=Penaeus vannamei TaxID=6689 RepID=UPI000F68C195|nr:troponin C, isotype gamma-like [Penaeus vannamei]XP_037780594.1 troponin C, isoallergen Bla g 6.0101-like [Penaeus monodon]XP_047470098.1 troponin C, isoallergen Bla g 6.0101-like [Penaeus chinensis]